MSPADPRLNRLRFVRRDIRAAARGIHCASTCVARAGQESLVQRIVDRYLRRPSFATLLQMLLRRDARAPLSRIFVGGPSTWSINPRVTVQLAASHPPHFEAARLTREVWTRQSHTILHDRDHVQSFLERILQREVRVAPVGRTSGALAESLPNRFGPGLPESRSPAQPPRSATWPERVFRRPTAVSGEASSDQGTSAAPSSAGSRLGPPASRMEPARAATVSPVELQRITEQVIHTIDRRIIASRERRGEG
jgi:hypothetical protein